MLQGQLDRWRILSSLWSSAPSVHDCCLKEASSPWKGGAITNYSFLWSEKFYSDLLGKHIIRESDPFGCMKGNFVVMFFSVYVWRWFLKETKQLIESLYEIIPMTKKQQWQTPRTTHPITQIHNCRESVCGGDSFLLQLIFFKILHECWQELCCRRQKEMNHGCRSQKQHTVWESFATVTAHSTVRDNLNVSF